MLKILQARLQQNVNHGLSDVQDGFRKGRGMRDQIANIHWIIKKTGVSSHFLFQDAIPDPRIEPPLPTLQMESLPTEPPGILTFQSEKPLKRLTFGGSLALQFIYSVTSRGCVIWKQRFSGYKRKEVYVFHQCSTEK